MVSSWLPLTGKHLGLTVTYEVSYHSYGHALPCATRVASAGGSHAAPRGGCAQAICNKKNYTSIGTMVTLVE